MKVSRNTGEAPPALDRILFQGSGITIGLFDCPRCDRRFKNSGPAQGNLIVFPRCPVRIHQRARHEVVANRLVTMLYNRNQTYERRPVSAYGDQSFWLRFDKRIVLEALIAQRRHHRKMESAPFIWTHGICSTGNYLLQRQLALQLLNQSYSSALGVSEIALALLDNTIAGLGPTAAIRTRPATRRRHRRLVNRCQELLSIEYVRNVTLDSIAGHLAATPFHLARVFARYTGTTIHQHLIQLRLRAAVDRLIDQPHHPLTSLASSLGFATPSHFASSFRRHFGLPPRQFRNECQSAEGLRKLIVNKQ